MDLSAVPAVGEVPSTSNLLRSKMMFEDSQNREARRDPFKAF